MTNAVIGKRLSELEAEVRLLKKKVAGRPDFSVDEKNWRKVKPTAKKIRAKLYKARYGR